METMNFESNFGAQGDMFDTVQLCQYQNRSMRYSLVGRTLPCNFARYTSIPSKVASLCIPPEKVENQAIVCI